MQRRTFLATTGIAATTVLAGCAGDDNGSNNGNGDGNENGDEDTEVENGDNGENGESGGEEAYEHLKLQHQRVSDFLLPFL